MKTSSFRCGVFALVCLCLAACKDKHDPLKPTVAEPVVLVLAAAAV